MDTPNPELMHIYGTDAYYLEKVGAFKDVLRLAAPLGWMNLLAHKHEEEEKHRAEAEAMNVAVRAAEAERMRPTLEGFYGHGAPRQPMPEDYSDPDEAVSELDRSFGKLGSGWHFYRTTRYSPAAIEVRHQAAMAEQAHLEELQQHAEAARLVEEQRMRPTIESLGKFGEAIGRSMARRELTKEALFGFGKKPAPAAPVYGSAGRMPLPRPTQPLPAAGAPAAGYRAPAPVTPRPPSFNPEMSIKNPNQYLHPGAAFSTGLETPEFGAKPSPWQKPGQKLLDKKNLAANGPKIPGGAPKVPSAGLRTPKVSPGKPWISTGTKLKGLGVLGAAAAAYGGYKLINKVKQKAEEPHTGGHAWGQASPPIYTGVSEYGHPVY